MILTIIFKKVYLPWNYSILFLELWLFINKCDRTSTTFYIPTANQCLIYFTNHIQILDLQLLKLIKNRHSRCQTFSLESWSKNVSPILNQTSPPPPYNITPLFFRKIFRPPYKISFEKRHPPLLRMGGEGCKLWIYI